MNGNSLFTMENLVVMAIALVLVLIAIVFHHEVLSRLYHRLPRLGRRSRRRMLILALAILAVHTVEIWLFGVVYWWLLSTPGFGSLSGNTPPPGLFDLFYFSASAYTTAGWGDVVITGPARILAGTEPLVGLVLITWSASFTYSELQRTWDREQTRPTQ